MLPSIQAVSPGFRTLLSRMVQTGPQAVSSWAALVQGIKAAFAALREIRGASAPAGAAAHDEDDPLFIG